MHYVTPTDNNQLNERSDGHTGVFHVSVLLTDIGIDWSEIGQELGRRAK